MEEERKTMHTDLGHGTLDEDRTRDKNRTGHVKEKNRCKMRRE